MRKVAIQGILGSYHDIAAHKYFEGEEIELICCTNFEDVFSAIKKDSQTIGMLAIENTIAGSLLHNNELLRQSGAQIVGEYKLRISHSFVCLPDEACDGTLTLEKKLRMFLTLSLRGYKVPEEEVQQILRFVEGLDIRTGRRRARPLVLVWRAALPEAESEGRALLTLCARK